MTRGADEDKDDVPLPRETTVLFGHYSAEREFLAVYRSGRVPHAWLIGGEPGIGKATLAYRIARFVLAHPDPSRVPTATSLALDPAHPTVRRIAVNAHSDLLALERTFGDNGKMRTVITVEQVRRLATFFGSTAGEGGWRVCIVDSADELKYPEGSNALLKMLEEPPPRSLFLLVSHAAGRCREGSLYCAWGQRRRSRRRGRGRSGSGQCFSGDRLGRRADACLTRKSGGASQRPAVDRSACPPCPRRRARPRPRPPGCLCRSGPRLALGKARHRGRQPHAACAHGRPVGAPQPVGPRRGGL